MCSQADDPSQHVSDDTLRVALLAVKRYGDACSSYAIGSVSYDRVTEAYEAVRAGLAASATDGPKRAALDRDRGPQTPDRCTECGVPFASHPLTDACAIAQEARDAEAFLVASATDEHRPFSAPYKAIEQGLAASATDDQDGPCPTCGCDGIHDAASATDDPGLADAVRKESQIVPAASVTEEPT